MKSLKATALSTTAMMILILLLIALPVSTALADLVGPKNPALGTSRADFGTVAWQNPENIQAQDGNSATHHYLG